MSCMKTKEEPSPELLATTNEQFLGKMRESWQRHYEESAFLKDLPRLAKRVVLHTRAGESRGPVAAEASKVEAVVQVVEMVSEELGVERDAVREIRQQLDSGYLDGELSEEHSVAHIFQSLEADGGIIKALKFVNQGVVLYAMSVLREEVFRDVMTKDVRTPEGWQIVLRIGDFIQIDHVRTEQSLDAFGDDTNHFEVQWVVTCTFDNALEQLTACSIRILRFYPAPTMETECLHNLQSKFIEGLIIV